MEAVAFDGQPFHLGVRHIAPRRVGALVQFSLDAQPALGRDRTDQVHYHLATD